jgi:hypothetical protein
MTTDFCVTTEAMAEPAVGCTAELERLGDEIAELSAHLDAATARLLELVREFDARAGWNTGFRSCAEWLSWRVGLDRGAARERVRVASALSAAGVESIDWPKRKRPLGATRAGRCTCIQTKTAWS